MIPAAVLALVLVGSLYIFGWDNDAVTQPEILALALGLPAVMASIMVLMRDRDILSPLHLLLYLVVWSVTLKTVYFLYFDPDGSSLYFSTGQINFQILYGGLLLTAYGLASFLIGYLAVFLTGRFSTSGAPITRSQHRIIKSISVLALIIAVIAIYIFLARTNAIADIMSGRIFVKRQTVVDGQVIASANGYLRLLSQTLPQIMLLVFLAIIWMRPDLKRRGDVAVIATLAVAACAVPLLSSSRLALAYLALSIAMLYHYVARPLSILRIGSVGLVIVVALGVLGELRRSQTSVEAEYADYNMTQFIQNTLGRPYFLDIGKTAAVYDAVPDRVDFIGGASLSNLIYAPIPRAIWPEKPILAVNIFVRDYIMERDDDSGVPPGGIAELYLNNGIPLLVFGMIVVGALTAFNYRKLQAKSGTSIYVGFNIMMTIALVFTFFTVEILTLVSQSAQIILLFGVLALCLKSEAGDFEQTRQFSNQPA